MFSFNRVGNVSRPQAARLACVLAYSLGLVWPCWASAADPSPVVGKPPAAKVSATNPLDDRYRQVDGSPNSICLQKAGHYRHIAFFNQALRKSVVDGALGICAAAHHQEARCSHVQTVYHQSVRKLRLHASA